MNDEAQYIERQLSEAAAYALRDAAKGLELLPPLGSELAKAIRQQDIAFLLMVANRLEKKGVSA